MARKDTVRRLIQVRAPKVRHLWYLCYTCTSCQPNLACFTISCHWFCEPYSQVFVAVVWFLELKCDMNQMELFVVLIISACASRCCFSSGTASSLGMLGTMWRRSLVEKGQFQRNCQFPRIKQTASKFGTCHNIQEKINLDLGASLSQIFLWGMSLGTMFQASTWPIRPDTWTSWRTRGGCSLFEWSLILIPTNPHELLGELGVAVPCLNDPWY